MKRRHFLKNSVIISAILILVVTTIVSASYTGPGNRTIATSTAWKRWYCTLDYNLYDDVNPRGQMPRYLPPSTGCPSGYYQFDYGYNPGSTTKMYYRISISWSDYVGNGGTYTGFMKYAGEHHMLVNWYQVNAELQDCTEGQDGCGQVNVYTTYNPATVTGVNSCTVAGSNGWCKGVGTLSLSSTDPMTGQTITSIDNASGSLCTGNACVLTYPEGTTSYTYWAVSSFGDTSVQTSSSMSVDSVPPTADLSISGNLENGWYNGSSPIVFTTTGTDATSGVTSEKVILSGSSVDSPLTYSGSDSAALSVYGSVTDNAGNSTQTPSQSIKIDTTNPTISPYIISGTLGNNNYYVSDVVIGAMTGDNLSGVASYSPAGVTFSTDGTHTQDFSVTDNAGNSGSGSLTVKIDQTKPNATLSVTSGLSGLSGWYRSNVTVSADATDLTSGIASVSPSTSIVLGDEGANTASFLVEDLAGNKGTFSTTAPIMIDTVKPSLAPTIEGTLGNNGWYTSNVTVRGNATDTTSGILIDPVLNFTNGIHTPPLLTAEDNAGNFITTTISDPIKVDTDAPTITFDAIPEKIVSSVDLSGTVQDATSGIDKFEVSTNGGISWTNIAVESDGTWTMPKAILVFSAAKSLILGRATDFAGNTSTSSLEASEYQAPEAQASNTPTVTPTRTPTNTPTVTPTVTPTNTEEPTFVAIIPNTNYVLTETPLPTEIPPVVFAETESAIHSKKANNHKVASYIVLLSFISVLGLTTFTDSRALEIKRLTQAINDQNRDILHKKEN